MPNVDPYPVFPAGALLFCAVWILRLLWFPVFEIPLVSLKKNFLKIYASAYSVNIGYLLYVRHIVMLSKYLPSLSLHLREWSQVKNTHT